MILKPAPFSHFCHHRLRLAIYYTPGHQDDQGRLRATLIAIKIGGGNLASPADALAQLDHAGCVPRLPLGQRTSLVRRVGIAVLRSCESLGIEGSSAGQLPDMLPMPL